MLNVLEKKYNHSVKKPQQKFELIHRASKPRHCQILWPKWSHNLFTAVRINTDFLQTHGMITRVTVMPKLL